MRPLALALALVLVGSTACSNAIKAVPLEAPPVVVTGKSCMWVRLDSPLPPRVTDSLFLCCAEDGNVLKSPVCAEAVWQQASQSAEF